jgi:serine/threonine protein kinase
MEALAHLRHPRIVVVYDTGQTPDGKPYLVMEYIDGVSLRSVIPVKGGMDLDRVAEIIPQIGQALSAAHDNGIYHRDLKPENIMLQPLGDGEVMVKLIDFGIATLEYSQYAMNKETTEVVGTLPYMAPEQLVGKPTASSDIYAMGVIAYEMVTGSLPFNPMSLFQLPELQKAGVKVKPCELRPDLPPGAQEAILIALSYESRQRQERARDLGRDIARALRNGKEDEEEVTIQDKKKSETEGLWSPPPRPKFDEEALGIFFMYIPEGGKKTSPFYLAETPISQAQWAGIMNDSSDEHDESLAKVNISPQQIKNFLSTANAKLKEDNRSIKLAVPSLKQLRYVAEKGKAKPTPRKSLRDASLKTQQADELGIYDLLGVVWQYCLKESGPNQDNKCHYKFGCSFEDTEGDFSMIERRIGPDAKDKTLGFRPVLIKL